MQVRFAALLQICAFNLQLSAAGDANQNLAPGQFLLNQFNSTDLLSSFPSFLYPRGSIPKPHTRLSVSCSLLVSAILKLEAEKVIAVFGPQSSEGLTAVRNATQSHGIPHLEAHVEVQPFQYSINLAPDYSVTTPTVD